MGKLLNPTSLVIDNDNIDFSPDSVKIEYGNPKMTPIPTLRGGRVITHSRVDHSECVGKITFNMVPTKEMKQLLESWISESRISTIFISDDNSNVNIVGTNMMLSESISLDFKEDCEITFSGDPIELIEA